MDIKAYEKLMKEALNPKNLPKKRARSFSQLYSNYVKEKGNDKGWDKFRSKLKKRFVNGLTEIQKKRFGLSRKEIKNASLEIKNKTPTKKNFFPVHSFYKTSFALINKLGKKGDKILDIGYGDYPLIVDLLNKKGFLALGIEPYPKAFDKIKSFKGTLKKLPKKLEQKYDVILANMVYSINYSQYFHKKFKWELKNKKSLIKKLSSLIKPKGYLILIDDLGTIFSKQDIEKYFKILLFEKDCHGKLTLLQRKC